jgi:tetratricopeptide (TPR) repeat protein
MWSQMGIAISNIDLRNDDAAESAIAKLLADYAEHPSFYQAVRDVGDNHRWRDMHEKARKMYQLAAEGVAPSEAFWVKMGLAVTSVHLGDYEIADSLTEQLLTQFANHDQLPEAVCLIGGAYRSVSEYDKTLSLYQTILELWPASEQALWTKAGMARIDVARGDQVAAAKAIDNLITDFSDRAALPHAVFAIGEEYYMQAVRKEKVGRIAEARDHFTKAIAVCERVITQLPETSHTTPEALHLSGECYRRLGQHQSAMRHYQTIIDAWPQYKSAWHIQFMIGRTYQHLKRAGVIQESEADLLTKDAYERVIEEYPDCPAARGASNWLHHYNETTEGEQK